ncbi:MAG: protein kinase [Chloroflexota bacterium]
MAKSIGRYEVREELGRGGMSVVYLAHDPKLQREVALKLMDQQLSVDPAFAARFAREARTVAALEHSAIVTLYDFGDFEGWLYLVMPYMKGGSLKQQIAKGPLSPRRSYGVIRRIGSALDKAHSKDIIHRDLKPGNILLDEEREAYLSDFGIVKVAKGDNEYLTQTGQTIGTFAYMSPEQLMGEPIDGRTDLYALGIVLYEMLTGKHPYGDENTTDAAMAVAHTQKPVPDVTRDNPNVPPACAEIVFRALAKNADDRYSTGRELALDMYRALTAKSPPARKPTSKADPTPAAPVVEQPPAQPVTQQPAANLAPDQPSPSAASSSAAVPPPSKAEVPPTGTSLAGTSQTGSPAAGQQKKPTITPLPRWTTQFIGLVTIVAGAGVFLESSGDIELVQGGLILFYWPIIGLLTFLSIFSRPPDWRWRLAIGVMGIASFPLAVFGANNFDESTGFAMGGFVGVLIGLLQIVEAFRGAGIAVAALGVASLILGVLSILTWEDDFAIFGAGVALMGLVALVLATVRRRRSPTAT